MDIRLANEAWETFFRAQATLAREFQRHGCWEDMLPREYDVLYTLSKAPDGLRITELGEDALLSDAGISRLITRLHDRGLVARREDPSDARASRIVLTPAGADAQRRAGRVLAKRVAEAMTRALDDDQLRVLRELSAALLASAEQEHRTSRPEHKR
ncbi:MAG TPA: MarR family winged helix-turn-helix transcriptional regulator [Microbacterium sp.]|nr:MarR family winged helix-turn-helix transcriptional regulator [Microbacterium sp.]